MKRERRFRVVLRPPLFPIVLFLFWATAPVVHEWRSGSSWQNLVNQTGFHVIPGSFLPYSLTFGVCYVLGLLAVFLGLCASTAWLIRLRESGNQRHQQLAHRLLTACVSTGAAAVAFAFLSYVLHFLDAPTLASDNSRAVRLARRAGDVFFGNEFGSEVWQFLPGFANWQDAGLRQWSLFLVFVIVSWLVLRHRYGQWSYRSHLRVWTLLTLMSGFCAVLILTQVVSSHFEWSHGCGAHVGLELSLWVGGIMSGSWFLASIWGRVERTPRCEECGYDLRGTLAAGKAACPECGFEPSQV